MDLLDAMRRANQLSLSGLGKTWPNPIVGAVLLDSEGALISEGFHRHGENGQPGQHAEIVAINSAGGRAKGSTLIVTLEPCNHSGKTPPCTDAIIAAGITEVHFGISDPHVLASGGEAKLRAAGIKVSSGILKDEIEITNRAWIHKIKIGRPLIVAKIAATLDGFVAAYDGSSQWITSTPARADVAQLRRNADAIVTGTGTVLADNPRLTARPSNHQPVRIVLGNREIPRDAQIFNEEAPTKIISSRNLQDFLSLCQEEGFNQVLLEAGPTLVSAFLEADLVDEIFLYQAPTLLGNGKSFAGDLKITSLHQRLDFMISNVATVGEGIEKNLRTHLRRCEKVGS